MSTAAILGGVIGSVGGTLILAILCIGCCKNTSEICVYIGHLILYFFSPLIPFVIPFISWVIIGLIYIVFLVDCISLVLTCSNVKMVGVSLSINLYLNFLHLIRKEMIGFYTTDSFRNCVFFFILFIPYIWNVLIWAPSLVLSGLIDLLLIPPTCCTMYFNVSRANIQYIKTIASIYPGLTGRNQSKVSN